MTGPRIMGLKPFMSAFWITVTSVVMRVTSDEVSKWSRFSNDRRCTASNWASRRLAPRPMAARAEQREKAMPKPMATTPQASISAPVAQTLERSCATMPWSMRPAVRNGIMSSRVPSNTMQMAASTKSRR